MAVIKHGSCTKIAELNEIEDNAIYTVKDNPYKNGISRRDCLCILTTDI